MNRARTSLLPTLLATCLVVPFAGAIRQDVPPTDAVVFSEEERTRILQHSPLPASPPKDSTNRFFGDADAERFGQFLFYDTRFSSNNAVSCATCHAPAKGWSDSRRLSKGLRFVERHSQSLWNVAHNRWYFWDGRADSLWSQALVPLEHDDEIGGDRTAIARTIFNARDLRKAYEKVFGRIGDLSNAQRFPAHAKPIANDPDDPRDVAWRNMREDDRRAVDAVFVNVGKALAAYQAKIISRDSPFDRFAEGLRDGDANKMNAISESAKRGLKIFVGRGNCRLCHSGPNFTDGEFHSVGPRTLNGGEPTDAARFKGVPQLKASAFRADGPQSDDRTSPAAKRVTALANPSDNWGQFKTPSLRSVATSPPYMHQGQYLSLEEVIEHYSTLADAGPGGLGHHREKILQPLNLSDQEKQDLRAFLISLTGASLPDQLLKQPKSP